MAFDSHITQIKNGKTMWAPLLLALCVRAMCNGKVIVLISLWNVSSFHAHSGRYYSSANMRVTSTPNTNSLCRHIPIEWKKYFPCALKSNWAKQFLIKHLKFGGLNVTVSFYRQYLPSAWHSVFKLSQIEKTKQKRQKPLVESVYGFVNQFG